MVIPMGSLTFIGMGLYDEKGISLRGLEAARSAHAVMLEGYTNLMPGLKPEALEALIGRKPVILGRKAVEDGRAILSAAEAHDVAFLVAGDPFIATTHVDLRMRAARRGIRVEVVNAPSIISVAPGAAGLQNYKFGKSATITFPPPHSDVPYATLLMNRAAGLHTLFFLDLRVEEGRFMTINEAIGLLLEAEARRGEGAFGTGALTVGIARAGGPEQLVRAGTAESLLKADFGKPPHALIVPGRLHFMEADALVAFAGADEKLVRGNE